VSKPLVRFREARGLSQAGLAKLAGISQTLLWKLEHRDHTPKGLRTALALAAALGVEVVDLWPDAAPVVGKARPRPGPQPSPNKGTRSRIAPYGTTRQKAG
jgi:transcriptional regulator with XRE-family HTH domain